MELTYERLLNNYTEDFAPTTSHEVFLVQLMARSRWKLDRLQALEDAAFEDLLTDPATGPKQLHQSDLATLQRFAAAAERSYFKAHKELQAARRAAPAQQPAKPETDALAKAIEAIAHAPMPKLAHAAPASKPLTKAAALGNLALRL